NSVSHNQSVCLVSKFVSIHLTPPTMIWALLYIMTCQKCYTCHFHLHPFPTRRSSDLRIPNVGNADGQAALVHRLQPLEVPLDARWKSTRLNSSHVKTSYAVFCLKKKIYIHPTILSTYSCSFKYNTPSVTLVFFI